MTFPGTQLSLVRYYNSQGFFRLFSSSAMSPGMLGDYWRTNYDRRIFGITGSTSVAAALQTPDGSIKYFSAAGVELEHFSGQAADTLTSIVGGGWTLTRGDDSVETYNANGYLIGTWEKSKFQQILTYGTDGRLATVSDSYGRTLSFAYTGNVLTYSGGTVAVTSSDGTAFTYVVDTTGNLTSITFAPGIVRSFLYENMSFPNALTGIIDENGLRYETIDYDATGRAIDSYLAPGIASNTIARNTFTYNADGSTTIVGSLGLSSQLTFVTIHGVTNVAGANQPCASCGGGQFSARQFDAAGYLQSTTDFDNNVTNYTFDDTRGLETQRIEAVGKLERRTVNTVLHPTFHLRAQRDVVNATGTETTTRWIYNTRGQTLSRCEIDPAISGASSYACGSLSNAPAGVRQWKYTYCDVVGSGCPIVGLRLTADGPRTDVADTTSYAYYQTTDESACASLGGACHKAGDLYRVTNALGQFVTNVAYDKNGRVTRTLDINGTTGLGVYTDITYTSRGWLSKRTIRANFDGTPNASLDVITQFTYDNIGNVTSVQTPDLTGNVAYTYDAAHRLIKVNDQYNNYIQYTLDAAGNRVAENTYDPTAHLKLSLARQYDQLNRLTKNMNSALATVQKYTNPAEAPPTGITYTDGYDGNGNAIYSTDGNTVGTEQQYDGLNRLIKTLQDHAGSGATHDTKTQYAYDARDNLRSVTDPDNLTTNYTYDGLNNLTQLVSPDTGTWNYTYDAAGNRKTQTDARGVVTTYTYDALNRLTNIAYPTSSLNVTFNYDQASSITGCATSYRQGKLTSFADNSGSTTYCYGLQGDVIVKKQITSGVTFTTSYTYTLSDRLQSITYPSGAIVTYGRDTDGRIVTVTYKASSTAASITIVSNVTYYPYGPVNVITFGNGRTLTKTYDQDYNIDSIASSSATGFKLDATVDVLGNLTNASNTLGAGTPTQQYSYDPLYRLINVKDGSGTSLESFTYGLTGDRLNKTLQGTAQTYAYAPGTHRLASIAGTARSYDANGNTTFTGGATLTYDDRNRMSSAHSMAYNYNGRGERVSGPGGIYTYDERGRMLSENNSTGTTGIQYIYMDGLAVGETYTNLTTVYYVETDQLGSPRQVILPGATTATDTLAWSWDYFAANSAFGENAQNRVSASMYLRFPGQHYDNETGLHYNYFRDYEAVTGRYLESDPIGLKAGPNTYSYVRGRPLKFYDPKGLEGIGPWTFPPGPDRDNFSKPCGCKSSVGNASLGAGGIGGMLFVGVSADSGVASDTEGNVCIYSMTCAMMGLNGGASLGGVGGAGSGRLCTGQSFCVGGYRFGGEGITGEGSVLACNDGGVGVSRGFAGVGETLPSGGLTECRLTLQCFRDSPCCKGN
jgi:RHS repeat-associated protein